MRTRFTYPLLFVLLVGCSGIERPSLPNLSLPDPSYAKIPFVHRIDIQQGNVVSQEMVAQLQIGMDKKKVVYIMGTPIIRDTFHATRWDYLYTFQEDGGDVERRQVTLHFENELLSGIEGDVVPAAGRLVVDTRQDTTVEVPGVHKKGMFAKIKDSMPFVGDDENDGDDKKTAEQDTDPSDEKQDEALLVDKDEDERLSSQDEDDRALVADDTSKQDESVIVPADAPKQEKKKGFFKRIFDSVGLGAEDEGDEPEYDPADPRYSDPTSPENPAGT